MKRQDRPVHQLPSFARYLTKVFDFRSGAGTMADARVEHLISPSAVLLATFHGFVFRLRSFQRLEAGIAFIRPFRPGSAHRAPFVTRAVGLLFSFGHPGARLSPLPVSQSRHPGLRISSEFRVPLWKPFSGLRASVPSGNANSCPVRRLASVPSPRLLDYYLPTPTEGTA